MAWDAFKRRRVSARAAVSAPAVQLSSSRKSNGTATVVDPIAPLPPRLLPTSSRTTSTTHTTTAPHEPPFDMAPAAILSSIAEEGLQGRPPLAVKVQLAIADLQFRPGYTRVYSSSDALKVSDRLCRGLARRIEHCTEEVVTRRDPQALQHRRSGNAPSPFRYELVYTIYRSGVVWMRQTFQSFQQHPVTQGQVAEIILSTHHIIGLFLRRHDKNFKWTHEPRNDALSKRLSASSLSPYDALSLACIPPCRFIESTQSFEFIPGYSIELSLRSSSSRRRTNHQWARSLRVESTQDSPLNLAQGENLLWDAFDVVNSAINTKRRAFAAEHQSCEWLEGPVDCHHFEEGALNIDLRISNSLGPVYEHLHRNIRSKLSLFSQPDGEDCYIFLNNLRTELLKLRDMVDQHISRTNDLELRVLQLKGLGWEVSMPARFTLDHTVSHSQRTIEAILDRVHAGIADTLRDSDASVHIIAHKRGHLILDKELSGQSPTDRGTGSEKSAQSSREAEKDYLVRRLQARIQEDLDKLLKDTCSLDDLPEDEDDEEQIPVSQALGTLPQSLSFQHMEISVNALDSPRMFPLSINSALASPVETQPPSPLPLRRKKTFIMPASKDSPAYRVFPLVPEKFCQSHSRQSSDWTVSSQASESLSATLKQVHVHSVHVIDPELFKGHTFFSSDASAAGLSATVPEVLSEDSDRSEYGATELSLAEDLIFTQESSLISDTQDSVAGEMAEFGCGDDEPFAPETGEDATGYHVEDTSDAHIVDALTTPEVSKPDPIARDDESVSSIPSLSHGEEPSPRDSLLMTPALGKSIHVTVDPEILQDPEAGEDQSDQTSTLAGEVEDKDKTPTDHTPRATHVWEPARPLVSDDDMEMDGAALENVEDLPPTEASFDLDDENQALTDYHPSASGTPLQSVIDLASTVAPPLPVPEELYPPETERSSTPAPAAIEAPGINVFESAFAKESDLVLPVAKEESRTSTSLDSMPDLQPVMSKRPIERPSPIVIARRSVSSWEDCVSVGQRDSVDTVTSEIDATAILSDSPSTARPPSPARRKSIPTAGYLGLHEAEAKRAGPFGALKSALSGQNWLDGGERRSAGTSTVLGSSSRPQTAPGLVARKFFPDGTVTPPPLDSPGTPSTKSPRRLHVRKRTKSVATATIGRAAVKRSPHKHSRGRAKSAAFAELERDRERKEEVDNEKPMLPRFMMLFAGMAVASSMLNKR